MKEADLKGYIFYDANYTTFWKRQNIKTKRSVVAKGEGGERDGEIKQKIFRAVKLSVLY